MASERISSRIGSRLHRQGATAQPRPMGERAGRCRWGLLILLGVLVCAGRAPAATPPEPDPTTAPQIDRLGNTPDANAVAVNDDVTAIFANPAGIGRSFPFGFYGSWDESKDRGRSRWDAATLGLTAGALGLAYQQLRPYGGDRLDRWFIATGGGKGPFGVGTRQTFEHWRRPGPDARSWRLDLGLLWRPTRYLSLGAVGQDLTQDRLVDTGPLYHRSYTVGLGIRPLPYDRASRLTLFGDVSGREDETWKRKATLQTGLEFEPISGITFSGAVAGSLGDFSGTREFRFGFGLHGRHGSYLSGYRYNGNDRYARTVQAVQMTSARQRTIFRTPVVAKMKVEGAYADEGQHGLAVPIPFLGAPTDASIRPVLRQLDRAETDPDVKGVLLELGPVSMGALTDEVRDGILRVRAQGKPVVAWMESGSGFGQYYIASACDRIVLDPVSDISSLGFRADVLYFGAMLDTAGVQFEKVAHGKYKTAGEQLILSHASEGFTESINSVIDDMREGMLDAVSRERKIPKAKLEELADGRIIESPLALQEGLVDSLGDRRAAERILGKLAGRKHAGPVSIRGWFDRDYAWAAGPKVVVLWVDGTIETGMSRRGFLAGNTMGSETVVDQLRALKDRRDVRGVVLRIDSGGGSGLASDEIWRATDELRKKGKKLVASMSRVAGSGGYYIACRADEIYADPMTITGSIGVLTIKPNLAGFYNKHRIGVSTFERGKMMGMNSSAVPLTPEERAHMMQKIDLFYDHFLDRVAAGRPLTKAQIDSVGQGRIWTGRQARRLKLIDQLGGLHEAVIRTREMAGLRADAEVENVYRPQGSWFERMLTGGQEEGSVLGRLLAGGAIGAFGGRPSGMADGSDWSTGASAGVFGAWGQPADLSPLDLWILRRSWAEAERPGSQGGWRAESPLLMPLVESY